MKSMTKIFVSFCISAVFAIGIANAAGGKTKEYKHNQWSFSGVTGKYDKAALQRGFQVYREVCASCHSLDMIAFRSFGEKGGPYYMEKCDDVLGLPESVDCSIPTENPIIKALAAEYEIEDGPDDSGDMFMRKGLPADYYPSPYLNVQQAAAANGGAIPPDFSLLVKARHHGADYIYSLLTGYEDPPETISVEAGTYYNPYYAGDVSSLLKPEYKDENGYIIEGYDLPYGGVLKMAPPLADGMVDYEDGSPQTVEQYSKDVVTFMAWASEPKMEARKNMGMISMIYLFILAGIVYASYKQIWSKVEH